MKTVLNKLGLTSRTNGNSERRVSAETRQLVTEFIEQDYIRNFHTSVPKLSLLLPRIPMEDDIFQVYYKNGFNLLQKCVAENNVKAVKLLLSRNPDLNRGPCSLPLHIACLKGNLECVRDLIEHGARLDVKARMCWPGPHCEDCPGVKNESKQFSKETSALKRSLVKKEGRDKIQNAFYYAIDGKQIMVLDNLLEFLPPEQLSAAELRYMLLTATKNRAWSCSNSLLCSQADQLDCRTFRDFLDEETETGAEMTLFHVLFFMVRKPAALALKVCKSFLAGDLKAQVGAEDYLGKTPLHSLIVRYAFEESRKPWLCDYERWGQEETKELVKLLLEHLPVKSLNTPENCALTFVVRYIKDWEFIYDLLTIIIEAGADPAIQDRHGLNPLMACVMKLMEDDIYATSDARTKEFFIKSLRLLCSAGADPNTNFQSLLTPLHILVFTISENLSSKRDEEMCENFDFLRNVLALLLEFNLDANGMTSNNSPSVYHGIMKLVKKSKYAVDMDKIYELVLVLLQYGFNPNLQVRFPNMGLPFYGRRNPFAVGEYYHLLGYMFIVLVEKDDILNESKQSFTRILYLLYTAMDHRELYKCLNFLHIQFPTVQRDRPCEVLFETVRDMLSEPRSLKHSARVLLNCSLGRKPALHAHQLKAPKNLQNYLINYDF